LLHVLRETMALAHPVIPFVTEELWPYLDGGGLLAAASYPRADEALIDEAAEAEVGRAIEAITLIRAWRNSVDARPGLVVSARLHAEGYGSMAGALARLARLELSADAGDGSVASVPLPGGTLEVISEEGLNLAAAEQRRVAERERLEEDLGRVRGKLTNAGFVAKAPAAVVEGERAKLAKLEAELQDAQ